MSSFRSQRRQLLLAGLAGTVSGSAAAVPSSEDTSAEVNPQFWAQLVGTWSGELSYLDGALEPIIQSYHSVSEIALSAGQLSHTEYKFYPAGTELARNVGGDNLPPDQGVELITTTAGPIEQGRWIPGPNDVYQLVDENTIIRHLRDADTGVPRYVTYWTLTSPRTLLITNLGILSTRDEADYYNRPVQPRRPNTRLGELKGCSVFRYTRLADGRRDSERQRLSQLHNVTRSI
jgi:hypothetical protein